MRITVNLDTQLVSLAQALRIKAGSQVPLEIIFLRGSQPVSNDAEIQLGLAQKNSTAGVVAFAEQFDEAAGPSYVGSLNANDPRLLAAIANKPQLDLVAELVWIDNGKRFVTPNFAVVAEPPILTGPQISEAGPTYLTELQCEARFEQLARKGQANGYAGLEANGKVPPAQLPVETWTQSVNGRTGEVTLTKADVGLGNVDNTRDADKPISSATQTALNGKAAVVHSHPASQISDSTAAGRTLLSAADAAAQRTALGAIANGGGIVSIVALTQAQYNALATPSATTLYVITA